ncbi:THUMP domain-containing protein [Aquitalea sp.]|uniref:THUMP domain-containing protein n=1 Tax=Aquitalea sp. TaxID=1872623 RepID=UPI00338E37ED
MATFRSRQRANLRRDVSSSDTSPAQPAAGSAAAPADGTAKGPIIQKKAPSADGPRDPYSSRRPAAGQPPRQGEQRRFDARDGERKPFNRDDRERKPYPPRDGEPRRFDARDGDRKPFNRDDRERKPYPPRDGEPRRFDARDGDRKPFNRDDRERKPYPPRDGEPRRFEPRDGERKPFNRDDRERKPYPPRDGEPRRFEPRDGERKPFNRDDRERKPYPPRDGEPRRFEQRDGERKPFNRDDRERKPYPPRERDASAPRSLHPADNRGDLHESRRPDGERSYQRDRGPSGRKPLNSQPDRQIEHKPARHNMERQPERDHAPAAPAASEQSPRKLFAKPAGHREDSAPRDKHFRRDEQPREQAPRRFEHNDATRHYDPEILPAPTAERENRFRRDEPAQEQAPRKLFSKAAERRDDSAPRDNHFRREEAPREQAPRRAERHDAASYYDPEILPAPAVERENRFRRDEPAQENAPRKLFAKPAERREDSAPRERFQREDSPRRDARHERSWEPRERSNSPASLKPFDSPRRMERDPRQHDSRQARSADKPAWNDKLAAQAVYALTGLRDKQLALFAPCPRGLEMTLVAELNAMGANDVSKVDGGVAFRGDADIMMKANLYSRTASRVLLKLAEGAYQQESDIYQLAMQIDWPRWFDVSRSIKVKTDAIGAQLRSLDFVSLKVKDAVCDRFRQANAGRPNVDTRTPDMRIHAFLTRDHATIYLDTSGEPLFKRGWREETGEAPLRENLAAGILLIAGYDGSQPLLDPMCGSGTFLVEAADIALKRAPGRNRRFGFQRLREFDALSWEALLSEARAAELPVRDLAIKGSDRARNMLPIARANLQRAGLADAIELQAQDILEARPFADSGFIVTNPPYGVRMDEQDALAELYPQLGDWLKAYFAGWTAHFFTGDLRLSDLIHLSVKRRTPLFNGSLPCRLFAIPMVAGSARREKPTADDTNADDRAAE